jgi:ubiquinone biosynthesis protein UbiJ
MTPQPLLQPLERLLNRNITGNGQAQSLARALEGKSLEVRVLPTPVRVRLAAAGGSVTVTAGGEPAADAVIEGTPLALAALAAPGGDERVRSVGLRIEGDAEVAQAFRRLLEAARPDLEEELSRLTGDVVAHHAANLARQAIGFARKAADTFAQNVGEYLTEESRDLPSRPELATFLEGVDRLREQVDRFEARLAIAEARVRGRDS